MLGWVQVQTDYIPQLLNELWIAAELERFDAVRLQTVGLPDALNGHLRNTHLRGQGPRTPVRGRRRLPVQRRLHHALHQVSRQSPFASRTWDIVQLSQTN